MQQFLQPTGVSHQYISHSPVGQSAVMVPASLVSHWRSAWFKVTTSPSSSLYYCCAFTWQALLPLSQLSMVHLGREKIRKPT